MSKRIAINGLACLMVLALAATSHGELLFSHQGTNDPRTEGWGAGGLIFEPDPANNSFRIVRGSMGRDIPWAMLDPTQSPGWTVDVEAKLVFDDSGRYQFFDVPDPTDLWALGVFGGDDTVLQMKGPAGTLTIPGVNPSDGFHLYRLVMDYRGNTDPSDDEVSLFVDGLPKMMLTRADVENNAGGPRGFSYGQLCCGGVSSESSVRLISMYNEVIPEPATLAILGVGLLALRRRR